MEIVAGKIVSIDPSGITVHVPYTNWERFQKREYEEVQCGLPDGRTISPEQRRKAWALMGEIVVWSGYSKEEVNLIQKHDFVEKHLEGLEKKLFSLSDCDMTTAREYITYLIDFILEFDVPTRQPLYELNDDIQRYVYACLTHKKCCVCGLKADLHHIDRVGMGGDRTDMDHLGMQCLPLCREHHQEAHQHGDGVLMKKYHLESIAIDEKIIKLYHLGRKKTDEADSRGR